MSGERIRCSENGMTSGDINAAQAVFSYIHSGAVAPYANACWFPVIGPEANSNATAAMAIVLNAMVVFDFIVSIHHFFDYK